MAVIGIDLGTTNSLCAVYGENTVQFIELEENQVLLPSVVSIDEKEEILVGSVAKEHLLTEPEETKASFKRFMGTDWTCTLHGKNYRAVDLSAMVLRKIKVTAEEKLKEAVEEAVITVPAYFNDRQRSDTKEAARLAGLTVKRLINEPSAAALAYRMKQESLEEEQNLLIFDFGGGTLDLSLVECFENVIEIIAVTGDNHLGGDDVDRAIVEYFCRENQLNLEELDAGTISRLVRKAQHVKCRLGEQEKIELKTWIKDRECSIELNEESLFQECQGMFRRIRELFGKILRDANYHVSDLSDVILVGGSSNLKVVQRFIRELLQKEPVLLDQADLVVAKGAGVYAGIRMRKEDIRDVVLTDVCPFSLGTGIVTGRQVDAKLKMLPIIERNATLPASVHQRFYTIHPYQKKVCVEIYQGESYYVEDNLYLGQVEIDVQLKPAGEEYVDVTFTYDINGILQVDVANSRGSSKQIVLSNHAISKDEMAARMAEIEQIRLQPEDIQRERMLYERAMALFADAAPKEKGELAYIIDHFEDWMKQKRIGSTKRAYAEMEQRLNQIEQQFCKEEEMLFDGGRLDGTLFGEI